MKFYLLFYNIDGWLYGFYGSAKTGLRYMGARREARDRGSGKEWQKSLTPQFFTPAGTGIPASSKAEGERMMKEEEEEGEAHLKNTPP